MTHPKALAPFLYAERIEGSDLPTVFGHGHGDVIRCLSDCEIDGGAKVCRS